MGFFRKRSDPIADRAKALNHQIAAIEAEIKKLAARGEPSPAPNSAPVPVPPSSAPAAQSGSPFAQPAPSRHAPTTSTQPRLRSTAMPHGHGHGHGQSIASGNAVSVAASEPVFEDVNQGPLRFHPEPTTPTPLSELGVRKSDLASAWGRLKSHLRGPATSNPKLVQYLSAGSIQGLRPLRYEKRVARNRFIVLAAFLVLVLLGVLALFMNRR